MGDHDPDFTLAKQLRPFAAHGVVFHGMRGNQAYGDCPFSGKPDKFYVNLDTLAWDSKTAPVSGGGVAKFLDYTAKRYAKNLTLAALQRLAVDRQLPESVFAPWEIGWTGQAYVIPIRDADGRVQDLRLYQRRGKCLSTPGCQTGLLGVHLIARFPAYPIFVCEGEWDTMALTWLLKKLGVASVVVGVPGAMTFKQEWVPWFAQRTVYACYDNDAAGEDGEKALTKRLVSTVRSIRYLHWPPYVPEKFDIRDWIVKGAVKGQRPRECWDGLSRMFQNHPRPYTHGQAAQVGSPPPPVVSPPRLVYDKPPALIEVFRVFRKWLFLEHTDAIEIMLATVLSNQIEGDPLWMFLVSPPGGAKTETLTSLSQCETVFMVSSLTSHSLISGAAWHNGADPSLIPKLNGRVLVIKDFTSILAKRDQEKDEIFGILRDAYDGRCGKVFGTGVTRNYLSRFSILAAVTPVIYEASQHHPSLGERFLKFLVGDNLQHHAEEDIILRSIQNINREVDMRQELSDVVTAALSRSLPAKLPMLSEAYQKKIIALAQFGARMRGTVSRDAFRPEIVLNRPTSEIGSRLGKQLAKLAITLAVVNQHPEVDSHEFQLVRKTMLDTIPQRHEDIVRCMYEQTPHPDDVLRTKDISHHSRYPLATVARLLADMYILGIVSRTGKAAAHRWRVSPYMLNAIRGAGLYQKEQEHGA